MHTQKQPLALTLCSFLFHYVGAPYLALRERALYLLWEGDGQGSAPISPPAPLPSGRPPVQSLCRPQFEKGPVEATDKTLPAQRHARSHDTQRTDLTHPLTLQMSH